MSDRQVKPRHHAESGRIIGFFFSLLLFCSPLAADTVTFKNGRRLDGTFLGGDARTVRFAVGPEVRSIPVHDIQVVTLGGEPAKISAPETAAADGSGNQRQLCEAVLSFRRDSMRYSNETNPIRRAEARRPDPFDYESRVAAVFGATGKFSNWTGTMRFSVEGAELYLAFSPDCANAPQAIEFATAHAAAVRSFPDSSTVLALHSPIAAALRGGEENIRVRVSGRVFPMQRSGFATAPANPAAQVSERQRYRGETPNAPASVASPRYLAKFDSVEPGR